MFAILHAVGKCVADLFKSWSLLEAWNLFLRHQLAIALRRARPCLRHHGSDRAAARMDDQTMAEPAWCRPGGSAEDFTLGLCNDYHRETFGVTALCPGLVRTLMLEDVADSETHKQPRVPPAILRSTLEAVAAGALTAIRRNHGLAVIGSFAKIMWWLTRLSPTFVNWLNRDGWRRRGKITPSNHNP